MTRPEMDEFFHRNKLLVFSLLLLIVVGCQRDSVEPRLPEIVGEVNIAPYGPIAVAVNSQTGNVYVQAGSAVFILNRSQQVAMIETEARRPRDIAVDEEEGWVYVGDELGRHLTVLKDTELVATVEVPGEHLLDVAVEAESGRAYIVTAYTGGRERRKVDGQVIIVKGTEIIGTVSLGDVLPTEVVINPINNNIYIGTINGVLIILNGMDELVRLELNLLGLGIEAIDVNPETGEVFVISGQELHQIEGTELIASMNLVEGNDSLMNMRVDPVTGNVYIINSNWEVIVVRDSRIIGRLAVGKALQAMTVDPLTGNVYVADYYENKVTVINGTEVIGSYDVGWYPYGIGVNPANGWVYVSNTNGDTITVLGFE